MKKSEAERKDDLFRAATQLVAAQIASRRPGYGLSEIDAHDVSTAVALAKLIAEEVERA